MSMAIKPADNANELVRPQNDMRTNSRRIYVDGTQPGVRVPFREVYEFVRGMCGLHDHAPLSS